MADRQTDDISQASYRMPSWTTRLIQDVLQAQTLLHSNNRGGSAKLKSLVNRMSYILTRPTASVMTLLCCN